MVFSINFIAPTPSSGSTVNTADVEFWYEIADSEQGITSIEYSIDGVNFKSVKQGKDNEDMSSSRFFPQSGSFVLTFTHGSYALRFRVVDFINNVSTIFCYEDVPLTLYDLNVDIFTYIDFNPPPPTLVNNSTLVVGGNMEAGGIIAVKIGTVLFPVTYPTSTTWQSTVILQEGNNLIEATIHDTEDNELTVTATVVLDTLVPSVPIVLKIIPAMPDYYDQGSPVVITNRPIESIQGNKESGTAVWVNDIETITLNSATDFAIPVTLSEGVNEYRIKVKDLAGNFSPEVVVSMMLDTIPPFIPNIIINDGVAFTLIRNVTLELSADDAVMVKVSENPSFPNVEYIPFTQSPTLMPFELSRGGGTKTVYVIFRDSVGNETIPVFDDIILPSTFSEEIDRADTMTIQALVATPSAEYLVRMQDNRDSTYTANFYLDLIDALDGGLTGRVASVTTTVAGLQTLTLVPDLGGPTGTISLTFIEGAEMIIYRYRTDVYDASEGETASPVVYSIVDVGDAFEAKTQAPLFEGAAFGRILEINVDGNLRKVRISKSFTLHDDDTAILDSGEAYPIVDVDGALYPIAGARLDYPLFNIPAEVVNFEEETDDYLITINKDFGRFDPTFGYEMLFSKRREMLTDYKIIKDTHKIEMIDESGQASGNVRVTYNTSQHISSIPSVEFKAIAANAGDVIKLIVTPTNNLILLSDLDRISIRFFHSLVNPTLMSPDYIEVTINDTYSVTASNYIVTSKNSRAQIREYYVQLLQLVPGGVGSTYGPDNPVIEKIDIAFEATASVTYSDEIQMVARSSVVSSNCRVTVNGEEKFFSLEPASRVFDLYELRVQDDNVDVLCNDKCVHSEPLVLGNATVSFGAGGRVHGDKLSAAFNQFTTVQYIDSSPTTLALDGRYVSIEAGLQKNTTLRNFEVDFTSTESEYPERTYSPDIPSFEFLDVSTVAIVGVGSREEWLVKQGLGIEDEGQPINFNPTQQPDGRHFTVKSFPIASDTLQVIQKHNGVEHILVRDTDYCLNEENGEIVLFHPISLSDTLRATYQSTVDVYVPEMFTNIDNLIVKFGTPSLQNTLSLGAKIAFENGARRILAVSTLRSDQNWDQAYAALAREEAYFIVPIPSGDYNFIAATGLEHVENLSSVANRHERMLVLGETEDLTGDDLSLYRKSFRTVFLQPGQIQTVVNGETIMLDGRYLAAAYAGAFSALLSPALPMTSKMLIGFKIALTPNYTNLELEQKIKDGITFVRAITSGAKVFRSITTTNSKLAVEQEQSLIRIRDYLSINLRHLLDNGYVGRVIDKETLGAMQRSTESFLSTQKDNNTISQWQNVRVKQDDIEPRQANVTFDVQPVFPLNAINITVSVSAQV